tara:strand:- start:227 stop:1156 length:930 start_codon:yes stop_codon:yes gene_type:complete
MKFKIFIIYIWLLLFSNVQNISAAVSSNIILKVENEIITDFDIKNKILSFLILSNEEINQENINKLKKRSLEELIQNKLKKIELSKYDIKADKKRLNEYLLSISSNDIDSMIKKFKVNNLDYNLFLEEVEIQIKWQQLIYIIYSEKIEIDEKIIDKELKEYIRNNSSIDEYKISEIEVLFDSKENYNEKVKNIKSQILNNGFENTALKFSISSSAEKKGDLGWVSAKALSNEIYDYISVINIGEVTKPIKRQNSIIFLKLNDKKTSEVKDADINNLKKNLINQKKNELFNLYSRSHLSKLKNTNYLEYK